MSFALPVCDAPPERDLLWEHCRNGLGIARLLVQESRPMPMVATACHVAMESACRAALAQAGMRFEGDVRRALEALQAPPELAAAAAGVGAAERLAAAQRVVAWAAAYLKSEAPERAWGF
jgi:hypothetical protein